MERCLAHELRAWLCQKEPDYANWRGGMGYVLFAVWIRVATFLSLLQHLSNQCHFIGECCWVNARVSCHMSHSGVKIYTLCLSHGMMLYTVGVMSHDIVFVSSRCG